MREGSGGLGTGQDWGWDRGGPSPPQVETLWPPWLLKWKGGPLGLPSEQRLCKTEHGRLARELRHRDTHASLQEEECSEPFEEEEIHQQSYE